MTSYTGEIYLRDTRGLTEPGQTMASRRFQGTSEEQLLRQMGTEVLAMIRPIDNQDLSQVLCHRERLNRAIQAVEFGHWWIAPDAQVGLMPDVDAIEAELAPASDLACERVSFLIQPDGGEIRALTGDGTVIERYPHGNLRSDPRKRVQIDHPNATTYPERLLSVARAAAEYADAWGLSQADHDVGAEDRLFEAEMPQGTFEAGLGGPEPDADIASLQIHLDNRQQARTVIRNLLCGRTHNPLSRDAYEGIYLLDAMNGEIGLRSLCHVAGPPKR